MENKITLIGGSGFVGTHLCRLLTLKQQDFEIIDLKISKEFPDKCKIGDIRDLQSLRQTITGNIVVNLAAVHRDNVKDKSEYYKTNVFGSENLAKVCRELKIKKIVFISSVAVYGLTEFETDEDGEIKPFNHYGRSKFDAEEKLRNSYFNGDNSLLIIRPTVIFGEGNRGNVFNLFNQIASDKFLMIGNGKNKKSIAYIGNVVSFIEACIFTSQKYGIFNYVDTPNLTMNELVSKVRKFLKNKNGVGIRLPYFLGLIIGYAADFITKIIDLNLPVSSIRIKKFNSSTEFVSANSSLDNFSAPFSLLTGIERTLQSEFISPNPEREVFYTE